MSEITPNTPNPVREDAYVEELAEKLGIDPKYIPKSPVWRNEEEIKAIAEMFANMQRGSSGGGAWALKVGYESDSTQSTADKTAGEILSALNDGPVLFYSKDDPGYQVLSPCTYAESNGTDYFEFHVENVGSMMASSSTDYPVARNDG